MLFASTLKLPLYSDISSLDPRVGSESTNNTFLGQIYESLFKYDSEGNVVPALCEKWDVSEDGLTYTFYLRDSQWSDGSPCTAYDFEHTWKKSCNPKYVERATYTMYPIKNAKRAVLRECGLDEMGVKALDSKTLRVDLEFPSNYLFKACCAFVNYKPISKKMDLENPDWAKNWKKFLVTNGAFKLKEWKQNNEIILEKNPKYWDKDAVKLDGVHFYIITDPNTTWSMFQKGDLDWVGELLCAIPQDALNPKEISKLLKTETNTVDWCCINTTKFPFNNKNFRKAIAYAMNRKEISDHLFYLGNKNPTTSFINGSVTLKPHEYFEDGNEELAKKYFQKALKETGKSPKDFAFTYSYRSGFPHIGEILQEKMRLIFNIPVELEQKEWNVYFAEARAGNFQICEMLWYSNIPDPFFYLSVFERASEPLNIPRWESPVYQYLFNKGCYCNDPDRKKMYYQLAEEHMIDEMPLIPLFQKIATYQTNPKLKGYYFSPGFYIDFKHAYFED